jgi:hypothetical protein
LTTVRITCRRELSGSLPLSIVVGLVLGVAIAGCHLKDSSSPSTGVTETFNGTLAVQGRALYTLTVAQTGKVDVTLTSIGPPSTLAVGLGIGTPGGTTSALTCSLLSSISSTVAGSSPQMSVTETAGKYCVEISDIGNLTASVPFSITIVHP